MSATEEINPYQAPAESVPGEARPLPIEDAEFTLPAKSGPKSFTVYGFPDRLQIQDEGGKLYDVMRKEPLFVKLMHGLFIRRALRIKLDKQHLLSFQPTDYKTLKEWIGLPGEDDLKEAVGSNSLWPVPVAGMFLFGGLFDFGDMILGVALLVGWAVAKIRPHRWLLLLRGTFFLVLASLNILRIIHNLRDGESLPIFSSVILLFCINCTVWEFRQFPMYRKLRDPADDVLPQV